MKKLAIAAVLALAVTGTANAAEFTLTNLPLGSQQFLIDSCHTEAREGWTMVWDKAQQYYLRAYNPEQTGFLDTACLRVALGHPALWVYIYKPAGSNDRVWAAAYIAAQ